MEFKIDSEDLKRMLTDDDLDMLPVLLALYLYANGKKAKAMGPLGTEERHMFYEILKRSGYERGGDGV